MQLLQFCFWLLALYFWRHQRKICQRSFNCTKKNHYTKAHFNSIMHENITIKRLACCEEKELDYKYQRFAVLLYGDLTGCLVF
jgi:hypothetical protein